MELSRERTSGFSDNGLISWESHRFFSKISSGFKHWNADNIVVCAAFFIFRSTKHAYGFVNSILLIVLLRPFQQPIKMVVSKIRKMILRIKQCTLKPTD